MNNDTKDGHRNAKRSTVIPCLGYRDAAAAIDWLCANFGFEQRLVVPNDDGTIVHAQLSFGNGMVMLGSAPRKPVAQSSTLELATSVPHPSLAEDSPRR